MHRKFHRRLKLASVLGLAAALCLVSSNLVAVVAEPQGPSSATPPNVVIVFVDDMGYADIGPFGASYSTPHLDRLAREGRAFTNFHVAQPVCSASRAALLTGSYSNRVGIHGALSPNATHGLDPRELTLPRMFKERGYATGMAGKWHLGDRRDFLPLRHGFDEFLGIPYSNDMWPHHPRAKAGTYPPLPLLEGDEVVEPNVGPDGQARFTARFTERAVDFIERNQGRPFFFYLAHPQPHVPLFAGEKFRGASGAGIYADVVQEIDWSVGEILAALDRTGVADNTLVVFTSDNGPWLSYGDHAGMAEPYREGKGTAWEGGTRVPCLMRWPARLPPGTTSDAMLMTIDLLPTFANLIGAASPAMPIDGRDVWNLLKGEPDAEHPHEAYFTWYLQNQLQAVTTSDGVWKLILPHSYRTLKGSRGGSGGVPVQYETVLISSPQLYHLKNDPGETTDASGDHPEVVRRLFDLAEGARMELGDSLAGRTGRGNREPGRVTHPR